MKRTTFVKQVEARIGLRFESLEATGGNHIKAHLPGVPRFFILPLTPSDPRALPNAVSHIRRALRELQ